MRGLNQKFINDLSAGILAPLLERVVADRSVCLEIREDYINVVSPLLLPPVEG